MEVKMLPIYVACIIGIIIVGKVFIVPIKIIGKLIINSILGVVLLYIINLVGALWQFHIGINVITALVVGILGIPGAVLLAILKIFI
ncbi:pro-sigmaK processing inhibitor BofA [Clostridium sp. CAG:780]|mgnify:FL=1|nr:pro-sigmaK processing inhibitor BofA [Clostridium sp. CAG:780]